MISKPLSYRLYRSIWSGLDLLYPPECAGCGQAGFRWCPNCQSQVKSLTEPICNKCGLPVSAGTLCTNCKSHPPAFSHLRSWLAFEGPIRKALHRLKYRRDLGLGDALGELITDYVNQLNWPIDQIVTVPLGKLRQKERGYNQVNLVARPLALALSKPFVPQALSRTRETASQIGLPADERRRNVLGAFRADRHLVQDCRVLLMDDVATTGSTLSACAEALLAAGAREVYAMTIARALPHHGLKVV